MIDVPVAQVVQDIPVEMQRLIPMVSLTMEIAQLLFDVVVHVPVVQVERVPQVLSWRRQSCSHSCETRWMQLIVMVMS